MNDEKPFLEQVKDTLCYQLGETASISSPRLIEGLCRPCGLTKNDTLADCLKRADELAGEKWHSGRLTEHKDLRRIVLMAYEIRKLMAEYLLEPVTEPTGDIKQ